MFIANLPDAALSPEVEEIKFWSIDDSFTTGIMQILNVFLLFFEVELSFGIG